VAIQLAVLRTMLQHAIVEDLVLTVNPAAGLGKVLGLSRDRLSEDVKALDRAELSRFLETARQVALRYYSLLLFLARTGARGGEGRALHWADLDLPRRKATIARTFGFRDLVGRPKSGKTRKVDLTPQLVEVLRRLQIARAEEKLKAGWPTLPEWVFTEPDGAFIDRRRFERAFARILKAAELPAHHTPHSLRHSYASILISEGVSPVYVSKQLGHHSVAITTRVYTEWLDGDSTPLVHRLDDVTPRGGSKLVAAGEASLSPRPVSPAPRIMPPCREAESSTSRS
jgi:integrase